MQQSVRNGSRECDEREILGEVSRARRTRDECQRLYLLDVEESELLREEEKL
jgi:hypothetical protein